MLTIKHLIAASAVLAALAAGISTANATVVVAPNAQATAEGNIRNTFPFFVTGGMRYQQVYAASEFSAFSGPETISQIAFRCDGSGSFCTSFSQLLPSIDIHLSTTAAAPDALSDTFAANVGADNTLVHTGPLTLSSAGQTLRPAGTPNPFDVVITLQTGFLYDPSAGNLLLDITNYSSPGKIGIRLDANFSILDSISRLSANGDPAATSGRLETEALVTQFSTTAQIAEPATLTLFGLALLGLGAGRRRKAA